MEPSEEPDELIRLLLAPCNPPLPRPFPKAPVPEAQPPLRPKPCPADCLDAWADNWLQELFQATPPSAEVKRVEAIGKSVVEDEDMEDEDMEEAAATDHGHDAPDDWQLHDQDCQDDQCVGCWDPARLKQPAISSSLQVPSRAMEGFRTLPPMPPLQPSPDHDPSCIDVRCMGCPRLDLLDEAQLLKLACPPPPAPFHKRKAPDSEGAQAASAAAIPHVPMPARAWAGVPFTAMGPVATSRQPAEASEVPGVNFFLAPARLAGLVAEHCCQHIDKVLKMSPIRFKIGMTCNPGHRWANLQYGYQRTGQYSRMHVLAETATAEGAAFLEAMLIKHFASWPGCENTAKGGEGMHNAANGPCYVYIVFMPF